MSYHIKNEKGFLCGKKQNKKQKEPSISLNAAQFAKLDLCCPLCKDNFLKGIQNLEHLVQ